VTFFRVCLCVGCSFCSECSCDVLSCLLVCCYFCSECLCDVFSCCSLARNTTLNAHEYATPFDRFFVVAGVVAALLASLAMLAAVVAFLVAPQRAPQRSTLTMCMQLPLFLRSRSVCTFLRSLHANDLYAPFSVPTLLICMHLSPFSVSSFLHANDTYASFYRRRCGAVVVSGDARRRFGRRRCCRNRCL
jgi:hypothetical protein